MTDEDKSESLNDTGGMNVAPPRPRDRRAPAKPRPRKLPLWKVLLHNDDVNAFDKVIRAIRQLTALSKEEAIVRTIEAHRKGVALLLVTHQERAELHVEQFASTGLTVTAEPDA